MRKITLTSAVYAAPAETGTPSVNAADPALSVAKKIHDDKTFESLVIGLADKETEVKQGPIQVMWFLQSMYGDDLDGFAEPGSDFDGNRPEKYKVTVIKDGERKQETRNWFTEFVNGTGLGERINARLAQVKECLKSEGNMSVVTDVEIKSNRNDIRWLRMEKEKLLQQQKAVRKLIRDAVSIYFASDRLMTIPNIVVEPCLYKDKDGAEKLERTKKPFRVYQDNARGKEKEVSISELIDLGSRKNIAKVREAEDGGNYDVLMDTQRREGGEGQGGGVKAPRIETVETFLKVAEAINNFADYEANDGQENISAIQRNILAKGHEAELMAFGTLFFSIRAIFQGPVQKKFETVYAKHQEALAAKEEAEEKAA